MTDILSPSEVNPAQVGQVVVDVGGNVWKTWANASGNSGCQIGVVTQTTLPGHPLQVVTSGRISYAQYNIGAGSAGTIVAGFTPSRGSIGTVIGTCDSSGSMTIAPSYIGFSTEFSPGGDITGTPTEQFVQSLSGANGAGGTISVFADQLLFDGGQGPITINQGPTFAAIASNLLISAQQSENANGTSGNLFFGVGAPNGSGNEAGFVFYRGLTGTPIVYLQGLVGGGSGFGAMYPGALVPDGSNYILAWQYNGDQFALNANIGLTFEIASNNIVAFSSTVANWAVPHAGTTGSSSTASFNFGANAPISVASGANPTLTQAQSSNPVIPLTGTLTGATVVTVPNNVGATWFFDLSEVTFSGHSITFKTGTATVTGTVSALKAAGVALFTVVVFASNSVSVG
jgi:hypothetical protein